MVDSDDSGQFEALNRKLFPLVSRTAYLVVFDWARAEEIAHEAFARFWKRRTELEQLTDPKPWLVRVAVNLAIDERRNLLAGLRQRLLPPPPRDPTDLAIVRMETAEMRQALLRLPRRERAVLALRFEHGLSYPEIGEVLGHPEATVKTWAHRALARLRQDMSSSGKASLSEEA